MWTCSHLMMYPLLYLIGWSLGMQTTHLNTLMYGTMLRYLLATGVVCLSKLERFSARTRIVQLNPPTKQYQDELDWDHALIWSVAAFIAVDRCTPFFNVPLPWMTWSSLFWCLVGHFAVVEPLYYAFHRCMHVPSVYKITHYHHHRSIVPQPLSGTSHPWLENVGYMLNFSFAFLVPAMMGTFSYALVLPYWVSFDLLNMIGHSNYEWMPQWWASTPLKHVLYTTCYHSLHHTRFRCNYALFCPLWDKLGGTMHPLTWELFGRVHTQAVEQPKAVFLCHGHGLKSAFHSGFCGTEPTTRSIVWNSPLDWVLSPLMVAVVLVARCFQSAYTLERFRFDKRMLVGVWSVPRFGWDYLEPLQQPRINAILKRAIMDAGRAGCTHVGLGPLNKARFLNGGGVALRDCAEKAGVKLVHGNTLTAAVCWESIRRIVPRGSHLVMTGGTSSIGEALVRLLSEDGYTLSIVTTSDARFQELLSFAPNLKRLQHVKDGKGAWWCLGKHWTQDEATTRRLLGEATVLDWAEPSIDRRLREHCNSYVGVGSLKVDPKRTDLTFCFNEPGDVPACLAALMIHHLEGNCEHEVGALSSDREVYTKWLAHLTTYGLSLTVQPHQ